jgi:hypothetical protein
VERFGTIDLLAPASLEKLLVILKLYIFLFYETTYLHEEVNCTKAFPFSKSSLFQPKLCRPKFGNGQLVQHKDNTYKRFTCNKFTDYINKCDIKCKVVLIRLGIYVFVNKARGGGSPRFFINTL